MTLIRCKIPPQHMESLRSFQLLAMCVRNCRLCRVLLFLQWECPGGNLEHLLWTHETLPSAASSWMEPRCQAQLSQPQFGQPTVWKSASQQTLRVGKMRDSNREINATIIIIKKNQTPQTTHKKPKNPQNPPKNPQTPPPKKTPTHNFVLLLLQQHCRI